MANTQTTPYLHRASAWLGDCDLFSIPDDQAWGPRLRIAPDVGVCRVPCLLLALLDDSPYNGNHLNRWRWSLICQALCLMLYWTPPLGSRPPSSTFVDEETEGPRGGVIAQGPPSCGATFHFKAPILSDILHLFVIQFRPPANKVVTQPVLVTHTGQVWARKADRPCLKGALLRGENAIEQVSLSTSGSPGKKGGTATPMAG